MMIMIDVDLGILLAVEKIEDTEERMTSCNGSGTIHSTDLYKFGNVLYSTVYHAVALYSPSIEVIFLVMQSFIRPTVYLYCTVLLPGTLLRLEYTVFDALPSADSIIHFTVPHSGANKYWGGQLQYKGFPQARPARFSFLVAFLQEPTCTTVNCDEDGEYRVHFFWGG